MTQNKENKAPNKLKYPQPWVHYPCHHCQMDDDAGDTLGCVVGIAPHGG